MKPPDKVRFTEDCNTVFGLVRAGAIGSTKGVVFNTKDELMWCVLLLINGQVRNVAINPKKLEAII